MKATKHKDGTISIRMTEKEAVDLAFAIMTDKSYDWSKLREQIELDSLRDAVCTVYRDTVDAIQSTYPKRKGAK